jgi:hypothetical protein
MPFLSSCGIDDRRDLLQPGADLFLEALDVVLPRRSTANMRTLLGTTYRNDAECAFL